MTIESLVINKITQANKNGNLAVFVGAGISKSSDPDGDKIPLWSKLIEKIKVMINVNDEVDFLKGAQYFFNAVGEDEYYKNLIEMIPDTFSQSIVHKTIFKINPHIIITTNWDTLIERENSESAMFYDVISNDKELVKSVFHNKIIKMHGDFIHRNIVFKEDDYLNYDKNFPLISNYIKSILSTHTVLFLGYSYSDINLKFIIQWLSNNTSVRPDMFLAVFNTDLNQIEYLKNHGIETVILSNINNNLDEINNLDTCSKKIYTFLDKIYKGYDPVVFSDDNNIIKFILDRIKILDKLNGILANQIQKLLTNCDFIYDNDNTAVLQFRNIIFSYDNDRELRNVYLRFIDILELTINSKKPSDELVEIYKILLKAGIKGIILDKEENNIKNQSYINISNNENENNIYNNFDFLFSDYITDSDDIEILFENVYKLYNLNKTEEAFVLTEKIIDISIKNENYVKLFIALFNRNIILRKMKYDFTLKDKYKNTYEYDIEARYNNLTSQLKLAVAPIYDFLNFYEIYKFINLSIDELDKIKKDADLIDNGGIVFSSNIYKYSFKHINLLNFVLSNRILIEDYSEYKKINRNFIEIALLRQIQNDEVNILRFEIYSCIKYLNIEELKRLLKNYYSKNSIKSGKLNLKENDCNWLINTVLKNCVDQYIFDEDIINNPFTLIIEKIFFILSVIKLSNNNLNDIFYLINRIILEKLNTIIIFKTINLFLELQYRTHKTEINKELLIKLIEILIEKINSDRLNGYEIIAISENYLSRIYDYASFMCVVFENGEYVKELIKSISEFEPQTKLDLILNFLLNIYQISNDTIKSLIKDYVLSCNFKDEIHDYKIILYNNALIILKFKDFTQEDFKMIFDYIKPFIINNGFSSILFSLNNQIDYMFKEMKIKELEDISNKIKDSIKRYQESDKKSIF